LKKREQWGKIQQRVGTACRVMNRREYESISASELHPVALIQLKQYRRCFFS
jgi:hypothetical protein